VRPAAAADAGHGGSRRARPWPPARRARRAPRGRWRGDLRAPRSDAAALCPRWRRRWGVAGRSAPAVRRSPHGGGRRRQSPHGGGAHGVTRRRRMGKRKRVRVRD
jgi:hypothetical protein